METSRREDISQIFYGVNGELAFVGMGIETMLSEMVEDFVDMLPVLGGRVRIDQYVIEVNSDILVKQVMEDIIHEPLKSSR